VGKGVDQRGCAQLDREELQEEPKGPRAFLPKRWIVERTFSWLGQNRRMSLATTRGYLRAQKPSSTRR